MIEEKVTAPNPSEVKNPYLPKEYYALSGSSPTSFLDSVLFLLKNSEGFKGFYEETLKQISSEKIPPEIRSFMKLFDSSSSQRTIKLEDLKLANEITASEKRSTHSQLEDFLKYLEYFFIVSEFRNEDLEKHEKQIEASLEKYLDLISKSDFAKLTIQQQKFILAICKDTSAPGDSLLPVKLEIKPADVEKALSVKAKLREGFKDNKQFPKLKEFLDIELHRLFLIHYSTDNSKEFEEMLQSFRKWQLDKIRSEKYTTYRKLLGSESANILNSSIIYERFDLLNQRSVGLYDLRFDYTSAHKIFRLRLHWTGPDSQVHGVFNFKLAPNFVLNSYLARSPSHQVRIQYPTLASLVDKAFKHQFKYSKQADQADYDFMAVVFNHATNKYMYIKQDDELNLLNEDNLDKDIYCLNSSENEYSKNLSLFKVVYVDNPDPYADCEHQSVFLFTDKSNNGTVQDLALELSRANYQVDDRADFFVQNLAFVEEFNLNKSNYKSRVDESDNLKFTKDTKLREIYSRLKKSDQKPSERTVELVCFIKQKGSLPIKGIVTTKDEFSSQPKIILYPTLESIMDYVFKLNTLKHKQYGITPDANMHGEKDIDYFLPRDLFVGVEKVRHVLNIEGTISFKYFKEQISKDYHIDRNYNLTGGIVELEISGSKHYLPFLHLKESATDPSSLKVYSLVIKWD